MDRSLFTAKFKRDYVAAFAVVIFFFIVLAEITLAIGIPGYLLKSDLWALQIQRQNLVEKFDAMRHSATKVKIKDTGAEEENKLIVWTLNMMASYLRNSRERIKADQAGALLADLTSLQLIAGKLAQEGKPYSREIQLDNTGFIRNLNRKLTAAPEKR